MTELPIRVFIVDDHPLVREWLAVLLRQQAGLKICGMAENAKIALAQMGEAATEVAIVDLSLKEGDGLDLIKNLNLLYPKLKVVVFSMHEEIFYVERAFRAGAHGYVTKRESTGRIVEAIHAVRNGQMYANPEILGLLTKRLVVLPKDGPLNPAETLSDRELHVFRRMGEGWQTRRIADEICVSMKTVQTYCARIKEKLGLDNATELSREAVLWVKQETHH